MKAKSLILTMLAVSIVFQLSAKVWRVNNRTINAYTTVSADFTTLQDAIDGASAGDTIYIEGSAASYGAGTLAKPLVIIGTGYFLTVNDTTQAYTEASNVDRLNFNDGSQGSVVMGLRIEINGFGSLYGMVVNTDSITIKKNHVHLYSGNKINITVRAINVASGLEGIIISQNYLVASKTGTGSGIVAGIYVGAGTKCYINNNIFYKGILYNEYAILIANDASNVISINNNVFYGLDIETNYCSLYNNIMIGGTYTGAWDWPANNLCSATQFPNINSNQQNVVMSTVFEDYTTGADAGFKLKAGSPAIGAAYNGGDCGVFSNDSGYPYVLSGMPEIPAAFLFSIDATIGMDTIPTNIKAITHNEGR